MFNTPFAKTFMLLAVAAVIVAAFVYRAIEPRYGTPEESLRVVHPAGFSMVQPRGWTKNEPGLFDGDLSKEYVLGFFENRSEVIPAEIVVTRLPGPPSAFPTTEPVSILGRPTYQKVNERRKNRITHLWFEADGVWYRAVLTLPLANTIDDLLPYLATLRSETPAVTPMTRHASPASAPATLPQ